MPPPTPETALLNRLFETRHNPAPIPPLTSDEKDALESFEFGLQRALEAQPSSTASTPSTSTLALDDDDIRNIFASEKSEADALWGNDPRTPRPSVNNTNGCNYPMPSQLMHSRRLSVDELNPDAMPFVPSFLPPAPLAPISMPAPSNRRQLLRPVPDGTLPTRIPRWLLTFRRALNTATSATTDHDVLSMIIVNSEPWDSSEAMAELAQEFAWRGVEDAPPEQTGVASAFAQEVYKKFRDMRGGEYGESFLWHIKEAVLGTYISVWDAVSYQVHDESRRFTKCCTTQNNNPEAISYQWMPSLEYVRAGIALGAFIGDLFTRDIITCANVAACLNTVMQNLVAFEHVEAIQALVVHAGPTYWLSSGQGSEGIHRFEAMLVFLADQLQDEMSVVRRTLGPVEVKKAVGGIVMRCDMWLEQSQLALERGQHQEQCETSSSIDLGGGDPTL